MKYEEILKEQFNNIIDEDKTDSISEYATNLSHGLSDKYTLDNILNATLSGKSIFDANDIIDSLKELLLYEIKASIILGIEILTICIIVGLLKNLSNSFGNKSVSEIALLVCTVVIIGLCINNFKTIYILTQSTISTLCYTMEILLPIMLIILVSMGAITSGTIMSPVLITSITIFASIMKNVILPTLFISTILVLINCLTEKDYVNKLSKFLRNASIFVTGLIITILSGIIAIQGLITDTSDGLLMGTARYSLEKFIPIVGGFTSDTIELFVKCMGSIKNIIGVFGMIIIVILILVPLLKILAVAIVYKITALLIEPIGDSKLSNAVNDMGTSLLSMGALLFFSSLLFIIFFTTIINLGGV